MPSLEPPAPTSIIGNKSPDRIRIVSDNRDHLGAGEMQHATGCLELRARDGKRTWNLGDAAAEN